MSARVSREGALRIGAPAALVILTALHPGYDTDASSEFVRVSRFHPWIALHLTLLVAAAAFGVSLLAWPSKLGRAWKCRQLAVLISLVFYSAFIGIDGVAGGLLVRAGSDANLTLGLQAGVTKLFSSGVVDAISLIGAGGWLLASITITVEMADDVALLLAGGLLVAASVLLGTSHAPPFGPTGAGAALLAALVLELALRRRATAPPTADQQPGC